MNSYRMLVTIVFFFSIMVSKSLALNSGDNFDDPNWTNSQWMIYELDTTTTPVYDFVPISGSYSGDMGYRVDTSNYSQEDDIGPTLSLFQNGQEYETNNLTVSTLIRFDPPDVNPYSSAVEGGIFLTVDPKNLYAIMLQVDYEPSAIEFDFGFGEIISGTSNYLIRKDLTGKMDYNIFYSLSVHIDSEGYFDFLLVNYETGEELVNIINFEPNTHLDEISVGLFVGGKAVFNDFALTGNPVDQSYASVIALTKNTPNHIITTGSDVQVYGTEASNQITLESGAQVELINFPGQNTIQLQSSSDVFSVSRSGTVVTFQGSDGTMLKIPATTDAQTIAFNDEETRVLQIHNNQVMLDDQVIGQDMNWIH